MEATTTKLCLTRKPGERLVINGPCIIEVGEIRGERVRLRVEAEPEVRVVREELLDE